MGDRQAAEQDLWARRAGITQTGERAAAGAAARNNRIESPELITVSGYSNSSIFPGRGRWFYSDQAVGDARWTSAVKRSQWTGCLRQKGWRLAKSVRASASTRRDTAIAYIADLNLNFPRGDAVCA